jgi:excisionase family DNA binding protein
MKLIDEFMDARQAAEQLGLNRDEVYRLVRSKRLRCYRFGANGGIYRFRKSDLQDYIQSCAMEPIPPRKSRDGTTKIKHLKG